MLELTKIKAIGLDLDDTLWPIWPAITRAEAQLVDWLTPRAPASAAVFADPLRRQSLRDEVVQSRPDIGHDMSALRRELIRQALLRHAEDAALAEPAFEVFFAHRMQVDLYADAVPALEYLASRFPIIVVSNGNADVGRIGLGAHFRGDVSAHKLGFAKPDSRIFHAAAHAAGVAAHEVLHVGDDPLLDVLGALDAGMQTAWVNREGHDWRHVQQPHASVRDLQQLCALLGQTV